MGDTSIEWTDKTWNPVTGCTKVSEGCRHCYAERLFPKVYPGRKFTDVQLHPDRLDHPRKWRKPCMVFVNSMSDLFHQDIPGEFLDDVFSVMCSQKRHTFQVLTKRPDRMADYILNGFGEKYPNVWLGTSVENQKAWDERYPYMLRISANVRFVSYEPALGPINFGLLRSPTEGTLKPYVDWIICGGESGPKARPMDPDWARSVRDQCAAAGVPFFMKQMSKKAPIPEDLAIRQWPGENQFSGKGKP